MRQHQVRDPDPTAPATNASDVPVALRTFAWALLAVGIVSGCAVLYLFSRVTTVENVGTAFAPVFNEVRQWSPTGIGIGIGLMVQAGVTAAVLHALASITEDITAIRVTARRHALHAMSSPERSPEDGVAQQ